ncbi:MAG: TIGR03560 family F420-dependent LLM class oxidoreductase [Anaerolineales bacterium]|jgi:F420-dependent oxidoreductase-like protein
MTDVAIMIEGQNGLTWDRWRRLAPLVEDLGFAGLYRSDHFTNPTPPDQASLECWVSLVWLASHTERIEFGPLVSPVSFRDPIFLARMGKDVSDLSGGRLVLGLGAGWEEREHANFGYDLLEVPERFDRFEEALHVITGLLRSDSPTDYQGEYYQLHDAILLPRPEMEGHPPILIGGSGPKRTLPLVARFADEWNGVFVTPAQFAELNALLDELLEENLRKPKDVRRSLMTGLAFGTGDEGVKRMAEMYSAPADELRQRGIIVGTGSEVAARIAQYGEAGAQRVMLQWLDVDNLGALEALAKALL